VSNRIKTFLFKYFNNILGINTRLSHFVANRNRGCTFCEIKNTVVPLQVQNPVPVPIPDESFEHLFYGCMTTREWQSKFLECHFPPDFIASEEARKRFLLLGFHTDYKKNILLTLSPLLFQYCIWEARLKKKIPSFHTLNQDFIEIGKKFIWSNNVANNCCTFLNFPLRRNLGHGPVWARQPEDERERGLVRQQGHQRQSATPAGCRSPKPAQRSQTPPAPDEP
jgi:hypothetical protein